MNSSLLAQIRDWLGFGGFDPAVATNTKGHSDSGKHGHTHGVIDPGLASTERGIWAIKWSFVILAITAIFQLGVVIASHSVALLADTIHNFADATTAIPLWIAFILARRKPSQTFTYGLGRAEDLAGMLIVLIILFSALVAGYQAIDRLLHPQIVTQLGWLTAAGIVGFLGNEIVAVFRIRVGRQMNSAALIADGYHARTDGLTSLAVVGGAIGVWLGFPLADPIIGLLITIAIFGIVWQSSRAVITRAMDGVDPQITEDIRHAAEHVSGIEKVVNVKARWIGHALHADVTIGVDNNLTLTSANAVAAVLQSELRDHLPALAAANVLFELAEPAIHGTRADADEHHHAPNPFQVNGRLAKGLIDIINTPDGERLRLTVSTRADGLRATVAIMRPGGETEILPLLPAPNDPQFYMSAIAPTEPHEFDAKLQLIAGDQQEALSFHMAEPDGHHH